MVFSFIPIEEPIDLLNVAFENPRKQYLASAAPEKRTGKRKDRVSHYENREDTVISYDVPDRETGREELEELRRLCPKRKWNFVSSYWEALRAFSSPLRLLKLEVDVSYKVLY